MIPVVPFGLIFGVLAIDVGFTPMETMGMSLIIFGGASQIVLLQLFSGGASSLVIISSVGAVNSRHLLYGAVVSEHLSDLKLIWKIIISYFLIDQAFARSNEYFKKAKEVIPGGIFGHYKYAVRDTGPKFFSRSEGAYFWDLDDNRYIDLMCGYGPSILGYNHPEVEEETNDAINDYFQCLVECDDNESVCKRICLETHL